MANGAYASRSFIHRSPLTIHHYSTMCGITGWLNLNTTESNNAEAILHSMCETIVHRGPDSEGLWIDDRAALGMRRLSIIDLKTGDQPVFNCDRSVIVMM